MGRECIVPFCNSNTKNRVAVVDGISKKISFHEIPSNEEVRSQWLKAISRGSTENKNENWTPTDDWCVVCSLHFTADDFGEKFNRLKPNSVPTVFPNYPSYLRKVPAKRREPTPRLSVPLKRQKRVSTTDVIEDSSLSNSNITDNIEQSDHTLPIRIEENSERSDMEALKKKIKSLQQKVRRLEKEKSSLQQSTLPNVSLNKLHEIFEESHNGSLTAKMLLEQIHAFNSKHRWSEEIIRKCILWRSKSPSSYEMARKMKLLNLPSKSTLQKYLGPSTLVQGFTPLIRARLTKEIEMLNEHEKNVTLMFDEMSIKPQLKYVKNLGKVIGETALSNKNTKQPTVANKILCFLLTGISTHFKIPAAYFLTRDLDSDAQLEVLRNVIFEVEQIGFKVTRTSCDCISFNVKTMTDFCGGSLTHEIPHPENESRRFFISFDPCHIFKNIRNQFIDPKRNWTINGEKVNANPIKLLYNLQKDCTVKPVRCLTRKMINPTPFEKMNVSRAYKLFSPEVVAALKLQQRNGRPGFLHINETVKFMEMIRKWFEIHNVCNKSQHWRSRNSNLQHFWQLNDERLDWLTNEFLPYIEDWKNQSNAANLGKPDADKVKFLFMTLETYNALKITTLSTVSCIKYLLNSGFHFILTTRFNSDAIEQFISGIRSSSGSSDATTATAALYSLEKVLKLGLIAPSQDGNCQGNEIIYEIFQHDKNSGPLILTPEEELKMKQAVAQLVNPKPLEKVTLDTAGLTMIAGYCLWKIKKKSVCEYGLDFLEDKTQSSSCSTFIKLQDRGGLRYPNPAFVGFVKAVFDMFESIKTVFSNGNRISQFLFDLMLPSLPTYLVCGCNDGFHNQQIRKIILSSLIQIQLINSSEIINEKLDQPKFAFKTLSKKVKKL